MLFSVASWIVVQFFSSLLNLLLRRQMQSYYLLMNSFGGLGALAVMAHCSVPVNVAASSIAMSGISTNKRTPFLKKPPG